MSLCECKTNLMGQAVSRLDHEHRVARGYLICPCGRIEKLIYEQTYRPPARDDLPQVRR